MAIALIPMSALAGSAVDMARLYVVKVRLQQACDAGVLAGRKVLVDSNDTALDTGAKTQADTFFKNNFRDGWMGTTAVSFKPAKTPDKQVSGVAEATVPMTITKMFNAQPTALRVTCEARYDVPDVDIVFVLDTTGSMACAPDDSNKVCTDYVNAATEQSYSRPTGGNGVAGYAGTTAYRVPEKSNSRIAALRTAVNNFFTTMANNIDPSTHVRYGFVTYSSLVNAGKAIQDRSTAFMIGTAGTAATAPYQSRQLTGDYLIETRTTTDVSPARTKAQCDVMAPVRSPAATTAQPFTYDPANGQAIITSYAWDATLLKCRQTPKVYGPTWTYAMIDFDVSGLIGGGSITDPSKVNGATTRWTGCIEERQTTAGTTSFDIDDLPPDLDPDLIPNTGSRYTAAQTRWRPAWPDVIYNNLFVYNGRVYQQSTTNGDQSWMVFNTTDNQKNGAIPCGKPIRRLSTMTSSEVNNYVTATDFVPMGGTYHDVGMIWGVRLLSPNGIFAADTTAWPGRAQPRRVLVFLTDGAMAPSITSYSLYGIEVYNQRVSGGDVGNITTYHNARFTAMCDKATERLNIDVWTISIAPAVTTEMENCASLPTQALFSTTGDGLNSNFQQIAAQVAKLRVSK